MYHNHRPCSHVTLYSKSTCADVRKWAIIRIRIKSVHFRTLPPKLLLAANNKRVFSSPDLLLVLRQDQLRVHACPEAPVVPARLALAPGLDGHLAVALLLAPEAGGLGALVERGGGNKL